MSISWWVLRLEFPYSGRPRNVFPFLLVCSVAVLLKDTLCAYKSQEFLHGTMGDSSQSLIRFMKVSQVLPQWRPQLVAWREQRKGRAEAPTLTLLPTISELKQERKPKAAMYLYGLYCKNMLRHVLYAMNTNFYFQILSMNTNFYFKIVYVHIFTFVLCSIIFPHHVSMIH